MRDLKNSSLVHSSKKTVEGYSPGKRGRQRIKGKGDQRESQAKGYPTKEWGEVHTAIEEWGTTGQMFKEN